jgi:hypothetical protein
MQLKVKFESGSPHFSFSTRLAFNSGIVIMQHPTLDVLWQQSPESSDGNWPATVVPHFKQPSM